jgi:hypothetical protein
MPQLWWHRIGSHGQGNAKDVAIRLYGQVRQQFVACV